MLNSGGTNSSEGIQGFDALSGKIKHAEIHLQKKFTVAQIGKLPAPVLKDIPVAKEI